MVSETLSHYRIIAEIGRGGMGVVYKALDLKLNREVALKVLRPELVTDGARKQRFVQEARAAAALTHPGIAVVYEIDEADGESFIAMELVRGKTLREVLEEGRLPLGRALRIARAVLSALATAHDKPIIHRDLKPENVMVLLGDDIKILDFGLAKLVEPGEADELMASRTTELRTREGTIMGTAAYMSPEQAEGKPVDVRSDVFSFGVVLYEILTGRRPFRGDSLASLQASILKDEPQFEENDASITTDLKKIVSRCLEKNKEVRYGSAGEILNDLEVAAVPGERRGSKTLIAAIAGLALILAAGVWFSNRSQRIDWARNVATPEISRLSESGDGVPAFLLVTCIRKR